MHRSFFQQDEDLGSQSPYEAAQDAQDASFGSAPLSFPPMGGGYGGGNFGHASPRFDSVRQRWSRGSAQGYRADQMYEGARAFDGLRDRPVQGPAITAEPADPRRMPKNFTRSDQHIKDAFCEALYRLDDLDVGQVSVEAKDGVIHLDGTVRERWMKHRLEDMAAACMGVHDVENRLRVMRSDRD